MILVDTSIWINHLRKADAALISLLEAAAVLTHPFVIGEIALGGLRDPNKVLAELEGMPCAKTATDAEVLHFIGEQRLGGSGVGYVDAHLLAAVKLTSAATLWTQDKRLQAVAERMGLAARIS